jgi:hypothetical protein
MENTRSSFSFYRSFYNCRFCSSELLPTSLQRDNLGEGILMGKCDYLAVILSFFGGWVRVLGLELRAYTLTHSSHFL